MNAQAPRTPLPTGFRRTRRSDGADETAVREMAALFNRALEGCLDARSSKQKADSTRALEKLFVSCLSSFERANVTLQRLNELLERQIQNIAHELHDESGQILSSVYLAIDELGRDLPPDVAGRLVEVRARLDQVQDQIRRLSHELRPTVLDDFGLMPALKFLCDGVVERAGLRVDLDGATGGRLPSKVETTLYRTVQEALTNAVRHARASCVTIRLARSNGRLLCSIRDDGLGFAPQPASRRRGERGFGLMGIRVRIAAVGGSVRITSAPGRGTQLMVTVPVEEEADASQGSSGR